MKSFQEMLVEKSLSSKDKKEIDKIASAQKGPHSLSGNDLVDYLSDLLGLGWDLVNTHLSKK